MKKSNFVKIFTAVIVAALVFSGCDQNILPSRKTGTGELTVNLTAPGLDAPQTEIPAIESSSNILKTVFPTIPVSTFTKYGLSFAPNGGGSAVEREITAATDTVTLPVGSYTLTVTGWAMVNSTETAIATGQVEGVTVTDGGTVNVEVTLGPNAAGNGTFAYTITLDGVSGLEDGSVLYITTFDDTSTHTDINGGESGTDITLSGDTNLTGSIELSAGYYRVWITLKKGSAEARLPGEAVHVYTGLTSTLPEQIFGNSDFGTVAAVTALELKDYFAYPVTGATAAPELTGLGAAPQYTGTIAWEVTNGGAPHTGGFAPETAYTAVVSLTAASGRTFDGVGANTFTYTETDHVASITNLAGADITLTVTVRFNATAPDTAPPADVTGLSAAGGNEKAVLNWTDPADADLDHVEITWTNGGTTPQTVAKGTQTYTATGLTNDTGYTFTVKAVDTAGNKSAGQTAVATPVEPPEGGLVDASDVFGTGTLNAVVWGGDRFVAGGVTEDNKWNLGYSLDGVTWTNLTTNTDLPYGVRGIAFGNDTFIAGGVGGQHMAGSSRTGTTWTKTSKGSQTGFSYNTGNIIIAFGNGTFVAATDQGYFSWCELSQAWGSYSYQTVWFTACDPAQPLGSFVANAISWTGNQFVVVGSGGKIGASTDGKTWTSQTSGVAAALKGVAGTGTVTVAVGETGTILSSDGVTWTARSAPGGFTGSLNAVIWAGDRFVAAGEGGKIIHSTDGVTWNDAAASGSAGINGLAWNGNVLVAVGDGGTIYAWADVD
jgi:hypothetical protein